MLREPSDRSRKRFPTGDDLRGQPVPPTRRELLLYLAGAVIVAMLVVAVIRGQW